MLFEKIAIIDENFDVKDNQFVAVKDDKIVYVGSEKPAEDYGETYSGENKLMMPGMYNAHAHSAMVLTRGYGENLVLQDWLNKRIFPFEAKLSNDSIYWGNMLAMAESLRFGVVCSEDMYFRYNIVGKVMEETGCKMNFCDAVICFDPEGMSKELIAQVENGFKNWHGRENGRILVDLGVHAEYTNTEKSIAQVSELAAKFGARIHAHVCETASESEQCKERHGGRSVSELFRDFGLFDNGGVMAHCVYLSESDMDIFKEKNISVASNPISNLKLASGVANVPLMLAKGLNVSIGTDGCGSNNNLNMWEDMKLFALLHKERWQDPTLVSPKQALYAATRAGAIAMGRDDCGLVKEGFKADLVVVDMDQPWLTPQHDALNNLVYAENGSDVVLTMVDGRVLYKDGEYTSIDIEAAKAGVRAEAMRIAGEVNA